MLRHDDRSLGALRNIAQIADLESDRISSCGVHFERAFHHKKHLVVSEGPLQSAGFGVLGKTGGQIVPLPDDGIGYPYSCLGNVQPLPLSLVVLHNFDHVALP